MKSNLQILLDREYELLRVAYLRKKESRQPSTTGTANSLLLRQPATRPTAPTASIDVRDLAWFNHYE